MREHISTTAITKTVRGLILFRHTKFTKDDVDCWKASCYYRYKTYICSAVFVLSSEIYSQRTLKSFNWRLMLNPSWVFIFHQEGLS